MRHARDNQSVVDIDNFVNHNAHSMLATDIIAPNFTSPFNKDRHKLIFDIAMIVKEI
jgi:hypothetical protein